MKKSNLFLAVITLFFFSFMVSCSDKDDTEPQPTKNPPTFETTTVTVPDAMIQSNDPGAQEATAYINMANAFAGMSGAFMVPPQKSGTYKSTNGDGPPWVYTWEVVEGEDVFTVTLTINETSTHYEWSVAITGTLGGMVLTNFTYMEASVTIDGSSGNFYMYDPEMGGLSISMVWSIDQDEVYTMTLEMPEDMKLEMTSNPDGSGEIAVYDWNGSIFELGFRAVWDNAGHGEWWEYYEGVLEDQGTW